MLNWLSFHFLLVFILRSQFGDFSGRVHYQFQFFAYPIDCRVFLLMSDYSLCKPHVQTCGGVRARAPPIPPIEERLPGAQLPDVMDTKPPKLLRI